MDDTLYGVPVCTQTFKLSLVHGEMAGLSLPEWLLTCQDCLPVTDGHLCKY